MVPKTDQEIKEGDARVRRAMSGLGDLEKERVAGEGKRGPRRNFTRIPNLILRDPKLTSAEFRIWAILFSWEFEKGWAEVSLKQIGREAGLEKTNVSDRVESLAKKGYLKIEKQHRHRNRYRFLKLETLFK